MPKCAWIGAIATAALALAGCATPYQDMGLLGGVSAAQVDDATFRISGRGNAFTDPSQINDYVLLKAAEVTLAHGYDLFQIVGDADRTRNEVLSIPTTQSAPVFGVTPGGQPVSGFASYQTTSTMAYTKPGEDIMVRMYRGAMPSPAPVNVYSAREVIAAIGPRVERHGKPPVQASGPPPVAPANLPATGGATAIATTTVGRF